MATSGKVTPFLDIEKVVKFWAWTKYDDKPTRKQKALRDKENRTNKSYIGVLIDWSDCEFIDSTTWSEVVDSDFKTPAESGQLQVARVAGSDVNVLFETEFTNNTGSEQTYTMKIEKTTCSTCMTEVSSGVTKGFHLGIALKMPGEILEMNAGFSREVSLTNTNGESFEEELMWGAESEIKVDPKSIAHAQLLVKEKKQTGEFAVTTRIRGYVKVSFTNIRDNNSFLLQSAGDIAYIVQKYTEKQERIGNVFPHVKVDDGTVCITTKGSCKFRYGVKQEIKVNQRMIDC